jgi:hypothetical protein
MTDSPHTITSLEALVIILLVDAETLDGQLFAATNTYLSCWSNLVLSTFAMPSDLTQSNTQASKQNTHPIIVNNAPDLFVV